MEFSIQILPPHPLHPHLLFDGKKIKMYVFIMFIITKFGKNFEEKIDICFF